MAEIKVHILKRKGRKNLFLRYFDEGTGKHVCKSAGTHILRDAEREAGKWQAELREGRYQRSSRMSWADFRQFYEDDTAADQKTATILNYASTFNAFERLCNPQRVGDLTTGKVTAFAAELRKPQVRKRKDGSQVEYMLAPASIARHLRHLKAIARFAKSHKLIPEVPEFRMPGKAAGAIRAKGRSLAGEEFERLLAKVPEVVGEDAADSWRFLLRGLWCSGLRLGEALALRWDHQAGGCSVALDGKHSVLVFDGDSQKSGKCQTVPLAPEAVQLLEPKQRAAGYVFNPKRGDALAARSIYRVGRTIAAIGAKAGIVVDPETGKTATAHDLRRSFGARWAKRVMPAMLKQLMRHASVETTMVYYAAESAKVTAAELWAALGDLSGDLKAKPAREHQKTP